jgi:uncharacterized membrane protein YgaE (UPF0421/DUF939 family)
MFNSKEIRIISITSLSVSLAYFFGSLIDSNAGVVASILALITLRTSLQKSINEGIGHLFATIIGIIFSLLISFIELFQFISISISIIISFLVSKFLKLGNDAVINISITMLIILAPGGGANAFYDRLFGTIIGVIIAIFASFFMLKSNPISRTNKLVANQLEECADLLNKIAEDLPGSEKEFQENLIKARLLVLKLEDIRSQANEAFMFSRWYKWSDNTKAEDAFYRFVQSEHITLQVRLISRNLLDQFEKGLPTDNVFLNEIKSSIKNSAKIVLEQAHSVKVNSFNNAKLHKIDELFKNTNQFSEKLLKLDDPELISLTGSTATALNRINIALTGGNFATDIQPYLPKEESEFTNIIYQSINDSKNNIKTFIRKLFK